MLTSQAAAVLACTPDNIRRLVRAKKLSVLGRGENGQLILDPVEIQQYATKKAVRRRRSKRQAGLAWSFGELAAQAFEMFQAGATRPEVVCKLKISPEHAEKLWIQYNTPFGELRIGPSLRYKTQEEKAEKQAVDDQKEWERNFLRGNHKG